MATPAAIYVTQAHVDSYTERCADYIQRLGLELKSVVVDDRGGGRWVEAVALLLDGVVEVIVVAERDELPTDRLPRLDVVAEERRRLIPRQGCRPQLIRRYEPPAPA